MESQQTSFPNVLREALIRDAVEITILDNRGRTVWHACAQFPWDFKRWDGRDGSGKPIETGDYIYKIAYADSPPAYIPFVYMKAA